MIHQVNRQPSTNQRLSQHTDNITNGSHDKNLNNLQMQQGQSFDGVSQIMPSNVHYQANISQTLPHSARKFFKYINHSNNDIPMGY